MASLPPNAAPLGRIPPTALLDLRRLAILTEVARCGSFSAAADALSYTPSAVSQQMSTLARSLDVVLFERTPRGMRLTPCAEALVAHTRAAFDELNQAQADIHDIAGGVRGRLRVGSYPAATAAFVARSMATFRRRFPHVELEFADGAPPEILARLKDRVLDLAVVFDVDADDDDPELEYADLLVDPFVALVPGDHRLAVRAVVELSDLADERILCGPHACSPWLAALRDRCHGAGFQPRVEADYATTDPVALQSFVATGRGITLVPAMTPAPAPGAVRVALRDGPVSRVRIAALAGVAPWPAWTEMVMLLRESSDVPAGDVEDAAR